MQKPWQKLADLELSSDIGWLDPDGFFYGCSYFGHMDLMDDIQEAGFKATMKEIDESWVKLAANKNIITYSTKLTPRQKATLGKLIIKFNLIQLDQCELVADMEVTREKDRVRFKKFGR